VVVEIARVPLRVPVVPPLMVAEMFPALSIVPFTLKLNPAVVFVPVPVTFPLALIVILAVPFWLRVGIVYGPLHVPAKGLGVEVPPPPPPQATSTAKRGSIR